MLRDEIRHSLVQFDDWHLKALIDDKDPDIMRLLRNYPRDADWLERARDSGEGALIKDMVEIELKRRGK